MSDESAEKFKAATEALKSSTHTVGAKIETGYCLIGNGPLHPVGVDDLGRLWREDGRGHITCIYDPRDIKK